MCVVYEASAKVEGKPSLNDCLFIGPNFDQNILDILLRFRSYQIALMADIDKAFMKISIEERDQDVLHFLWVDNSDDVEIKIPPLRFTGVIVGICSKSIPV